jgi:hypothetical protein
MTCGLLHTAVKCHSFCLLGKNQGSSHEIAPSSKGRHTPDVLWLVAPAAKCHYQFPRVRKQGEMAPPNNGSHVPDVLWLLHLPPNAIINPRACGSRVVHTIWRRQIKGGMPQMPCWNTRCILEGIHFAGGFWTWLRGVGTNRRPACKNTPVR